MEPDTLQCKNPQHPLANRHTMRCIKETPEYFVFGCQACLDINHVESIQVKTRARVRQEIRQSLDKQGRLLKAMPPRLRRMVMDDSLRKRKDPIDEHYSRPTS